VDEQANQGRLNLEDRIRISEEMIRDARERGDWTLPCLLFNHKALLALKDVLPAEVNDD
jgi:hypothetical protein